MRSTFLSRSLPALAAAALLGAAGASSAMVEYRVWYDDDLYEAYDYGDIALGNSAAMTPPSWACGRRFFNPSWYQWRGDYMQTLSSGDFYSNVHVWLPLGNGCPHDKIVVQKQNGSATYAAPEGTHVLSIHTNYGSSWINAQGSWPGCNCALPKPYLTLATLDHRWGMVQLSFDEALRLPQQRSGTVLAQGLQKLSALQFDLAKRIGERRRGSFDKIEAVVRQLEDQALAQTAQAADQAEVCRREIGAGRDDSARRACADAARAVGLAQASMAIVADEVRP